MKPLDPRLVRRARSLRPFLVGSAVLTLLDTALLLVQVFVLGRALGGVVEGGWPAARVATAASWLVLATLGRAAVGAGATMWGRRAASKITGDLRATLLERFLTDPSRRAPGEIGVLGTRGVDALEPYVMGYLPTMVSAALVPPIVWVAALLVDRTSGVLLCITLPLVPVFMVLVGKFSAERSRRSWASLQRLAGHVLDVVTGLPTLKGFGRHHAQAKTIERLGERHRRAAMQALRSAFLSALVLELLASLSVALVAVSVGLRLVSAHIALAPAFVVLLLAPECFAPLRRLGAAYHSATEGLEAAADILAVVDAPVAPRGDAPVPERVRVECEHVRVTHAGRATAAPIDATFAVRPGEIVALTGTNGAGKSTLLSVLRGRVIPDGGRVTVDGVQLAAIDRDAWNDTVAWVPQHAALSDASVHANLAMAVPGVPLDVVREVAGSLGIASLLERRARSLSAGEQQRVALARAVLKCEHGPARLVLLDEPSANLDAGTETLVAETVRRLARGGATVLLVAHRTALVAVADRVVELVSGAPAALPLPTVGGLGAVATGARPGSERSAPPEPVAVAPRSSAPLRWLWREAGPLRGRLGAAVALAALATLSGIALTACAAWLLSRASEHPPVLELGVAVVLVRALALSKAVLRYGERLESHDAVLRLMTRLRVRVYEQLAVVAPGGLAGGARGDVLSRVVGDLDVVQDLVLRALLPPLAAAAVAASVVVGAALVFPAGAAVLAIGLLLALVAVPAAAAALERRAGVAVAGERVALTIEAVDIAETAEELAAFNAAPGRLATLARHEKRLAAFARREARAAAFGDALEVVLAGATAAALLVVGAAAVRGGTLGALFVAPIVLLGWMLADVAGTMPAAIRRASGLQAAAARITDVLAATDAVPDPASPLAPPPAPLGVRIDNAVVRWPGAARPTLTGVDLELLPGSRTVLVGASGAGKSTLAAALVRFVPLQDGTISIGGTDVAALRGDDVRELVGWCAQDAHFFDTTIADNLRIARPHATDAELERVVHDVRLAAWLAALPRGLQTRVGVGGAELSGGEAQRLALARELLADRPIIVLDEPTANVDAGTAEALMADLLAAVSGRTVLVITHGPYGLELADRVVTLEDGRTREPSRAPA